MLDHPEQAQNLDAPLTEYAAANNLDVKVRGVKVIGTLLRLRRGGSPQQLPPAQRPR